MGLTESDLGLSSGRRRSREVASMSDEDDGRRHGEKGVEGAINHLRERWVEFPKNCWLGNEDEDIAAEEE